MGLTKDIKILLVEDASVMRKMEIKTLNVLGFKNIIEAVDGNDAINQLNKHIDVKLIISDWNMPEKDGFELLQWVRTNKATKEIPFLMATGRGEKKEAKQAKEAGVSAFISKPFNKDELLEKIEEAFGLKEEEVKVVRTKADRTSGNGKLKINAAHIQITDHLTLGVLKHLISKGDLNPAHFELETECMSSWNTVAKALEDGSAEAAFILAPLAMDLYNDGTPINLILFAHKNGSCCVRNSKGGNFSEMQKDFFKEKSFYIPHTMSIHNMLGHIFFSNNDVKPGVTGQKDVDVEFEVVAPIKMPEFLAENSDACGYLVAEPLGTKAIAAGNAELQFLSSELWHDHPCCVLAVQQDVVKDFPEALDEFTKMLVHAGKFIEEKPGLAAEIAVEFLDPKKELGLKVPVLRNVLTEPKGIKTNNLYPNKSDLDLIQKYMHNEMGVGSIIDIDKFVDMKFANSACTDSDKKANRKTTIEELTSKARNLMHRDEDFAADQSTKALLNLEGKYLKFELNKQQYGVDILKIVEIIKLPPVTMVPNTNNYVKGVINLRGSVVPVIDLRIKLNLKSVDYTDKTRIIIVENEVDGLLLRVGLIVDNVASVHDVVASEIDAAPSFGEKDNKDHILAVVKTEKSVYVLLNLDTILKPEKKY
ncbi:MAG: chemotaxis protein CheW [Melioribacteraceae bacterium]|nr:chemotaxis protein CheW [Melioribacteraceae bacterium]